MRRTVAEDGTARAKALRHEAHELKGSFYGFGQKAREGGILGVARGSVASDPKASCSCRQGMIVACRRTV